MRRASPPRVRSRHRGTTLIVGLMLLGLVTLLGLAGASTAHVELRLAQNERFRENASAAASAGIEFAIGRVSTAAAPASVSGSTNGSLPDTQDHFTTVTRFAGFELSLPQAEGGFLAGAHFEIESTGSSARRATDRQRATVMLVVAHPDAAPLPCNASAGMRCFRAGELVRTSWQRVHAE